ncbi:MAG: AAC(3) family N-acetyltransferase, partial [Pseudomonadales bacterium]|nr:AAC(3) family N-acetyltransferase [Pseudomonadales bacterium]
LLKTLWKYDGRELAVFLKKTGVKKGDTLAVHSSWLAGNGFDGSPLDFINVLKSVITEDGLLVMMSMPYHNQSSAEFIRSGGQMKVNRSPSKMGLLSEVFRRGRDTERSLSPTHPVLAWGKEAKAFVADHINCLEPFGKGSPFEKMLDRNAAIIAVDTPFSTVTFTHFLEDCISDKLPFSLYENEPLMGKVINEMGEEVVVPVRVLSNEANIRRRENRLVEFFDREGVLKYSKLGATRFIYLQCAQAYSAINKMYDQQLSMFD